MELRGMVAGVGRPLIPSQPERILNAVLDADVNVVDAAVHYGEAEAHIGRYIASRRQAGVVKVTWFNTITGLEVDYRRMLDTYAAGANPVTSRQFWNR
jgi:aryl-alcohol dehydrogenase-like predicted oxidoreductase